MLFFSMCGGVQKSGDEKLVTLYDRNLKLASIMSICVYHCKRNLDDKIIDYTPNFDQNIKTSQKIFLSNSSSK